MAKEKESKVKNENKHFMKDVKAELKKVVWPTSKQMVNNVTAVIVIVLITAAIVFCLDFVFGAMNKFGVERLKEKVQSNNQTQVVDTQTNNENQQVEENTENTPVNE
ncbi:MAG: preprotein translocase subunit SecE [Clostridia bacterium]|nr:preprotein translocase subunit SecE [Clostridia bacterium]